MSADRNAPSQDTAATMLRNAIRDLGLKAQGLDDMLIAAFPKSNAAFSKRKNAQHQAVNFLRENMNLEKGFESQYDCVKHFREVRKKINAEFSKPEYKSLREEDKLFMVYILKMHQAIATARLDYLRALDRVNYYKLEDKLQMPSSIPLEVNSLLQDHDEQFPPKETYAPTIEEEMNKPDSDEKPEETKKTAVQKQAEEVEVAREAYEHHLDDLYKPSDVDFINDFTLLLVEFNDINDRLNTSKNSPVNLEDSPNEDHALLIEKYEELQTLLAQMQDYVDRKNALVGNVAMARVHLKEKQDSFEKADQSQKNQLSSTQETLYAVCYDHLAGIAIRDTDAALKRLSWMLGHPLLTPRAACKNLVGNKALGSEMGSLLATDPIVIGNAALFPESQVGTLLRLVEACDNYEGVIDLKERPADTHDDPDQRKAFDEEMQALARSMAVFTLQMDALANTPNLLQAQMRNRSQTAPPAYSRQNEQKEDVVFDKTASDPVRSTTQSSFFSEQTAITKKDLATIKNMITWLGKQTRKSGSNANVWEEIEALERLEASLQALPNGGKIETTDSTHRAAMSILNSYKDTPDFIAFNKSHSASTSLTSSTSSAAGKEKKVTRSRTITDLLKITGRDSSSSEKMKGEKESRKKKYTFKSIKYRP